jgi:hypothetical protein
MLPISLDEEHGHGKEIDQPGDEQGAQRETMHETVSSGAKKDGGYHGTVRTIVGRRPQ